MRLLGISGRRNLGSRFLGLGTLGRNSLHEVIWSLTKNITVKDNKTPAYHQHILRPQTLSEMPSRTMKAQIKEEKFHRN